MLECNTVFDQHHVICNIVIYADDNTFFSKCDQASYLWQQLALASELESDLRDTVDWGWKWPVYFNAGKKKLILFNQSNYTGAIDVQMNGSVLEEKLSFKMMLGFPLGLLLYLYCQNPLKENWSIDYEVFFLLRFPCISINRPYGLTWNTAFMSGLVLLAATWKF